MTKHSLLNFLIYQVREKVYFNYSTKIENKPEIKDVLKYITKTKQKELIEILKSAVRTQDYVRLTEFVNKNYEYI